MIVEDNFAPFILLKSCLMGTTVNVVKFRTPFNSYFSQNKILVMVAGIRKMLVRKANRKGQHCLSRHFLTVNCVHKF